MPYEIKYHKNVNGYRRVKPKEAKEIYNRGGDLYLLPYKVEPTDRNVNRVNISMHTKKDHNGIVRKAGWDAVIDKYTYYYCTVPRGVYPAVYVKEEDYDGEA